MEKDIKTVLAECGFSFKKKFGQNFITDKNLLLSIVDKADIQKDDTVIEIGCGAGTLTRALSAAAKKVIAFEIDTSLKPVLEQTLSGCDNTEVIFNDFLKIDLPGFEKQAGQYKVVANLPYYVTTPLILKLIEQSKQCKSITVMVQEEGAERLCAKADTPEYGAITAVIALRAYGEIVKRVPSTMFMPRPNVDSAVVKLTVKDGAISVSDPALYKKTVHAAFSARRKTLVNNIINCFSVSRADAEAALTACGIDIKARGETLTPGQLAALSEHLKNFV